MSESPDMGHPTGAAVTAILGMSGESRAASCGFGEAKFGPPHRFAQSSIYDYERIRKTVRNSAEGERCLTSL
jgi:hypothetical protein